MSKAVLRGAKNFISQQVVVCEPWAFKPAVPPDCVKDKGLYTKWRQNPATEHLLYFAVEGLNPAIRANKNTNPLTRLHAIVADYDAPVGDEAFDSVLERASADYKPNWIHRTMHSGGVRLIWMLEAPLALEVKELGEQFLKIVRQELQIDRFFASPDEKAFDNLCKPWDVGHTWRKLSDTPIPSNVLNYWLFEASDKVRWKEIGDLVIPIEKVADEVEKKYPGRWSGPFEVGQRGVNFWDMNSTNPSAATITETGMMSFSSEKGYYSWAELLGAKFIQDYQADKIGTAVDGVWFDGRHYFLRPSFGSWEPHAKEDFVSRLKVKHDMEARTDRSETASDVERTLVFLHENKRVTGALPQVFNPNEIIYYNQKRFLNNATVKPHGYADTPQEWGVNFPWHAEFLDTCFSSVLVPCVVPIGHKARPAMPAKEIFLCWWKRVYCSAVAGALERGHALFLAGDVNLGKTLLSTRIVGASLGGASDASDFLNVNTQFNKELLEVALWCIDDAVACQDAQAHQRFSEMIKRAVANPFFAYRAMYSDSARVEWAGRVIVTFNSDISSARIIPNLDSSIADKILVLQFAKLLRTFPESGKLLNIIAAELPFVLRWLIDWTPPIQLTDGAPPRFGMHSYIDADLRMKSLNAGGMSDLLEIIDLWLTRSGIPLREEHGDYWEGSAAAWFSKLSLDEGMRHLIAKYTARQLARKFVDASQIPGSGVSVIEGQGHHGNKYRIKLIGRDDVKPIDDAK
jgi:hypothetical protein